VLPAAERLRRPGLFQRVYNGKKSVSTTLLTLYVLEKTPGSAARFPLVGFVIGKKMEGRATQRNRAKRRVREAYRLLRQDLEAQATENSDDETTRIMRILKDWYAIVWVIKSEVLTAEFEDIYRDVSECIFKAAVRYGKAPQRKTK
jgi:ribonuclease P protein component